MGKKIVLKFNDFLLHSGQKSWWKVDCDTIWEDQDSLYFLAEKIIQKVGPFSVAIGIPRGGLDLAKELNLQSHDFDDCILLVDDVYTTGRSMREEREKLLLSGIKEVKGVVLITRNKYVDHWITPLFYIEEIEDVNGYR